MTWRTSPVALLMMLLCGVTAQAQMEQPGLRDLEEEEAAQPRRTPQLTRPPRLIQQVPPIFPEQARKEGRTGNVVLRLTVDDTGGVQRVDVLQSAGVDLDHAAMGAACNFVFEPAQVDGVNASIQVDFKQAFTLSVVKKEVAVEPPPADVPATTGAAPSSTTPQTPEVPAGPLNYRGIVRESGTKVALADAEVTILPEDADPIAATTDAGGRFEVRGVPRGKHLVRVAHAGHEVFSTVEEFSDKELLEVRYFLPARSYNRFETIIRSQKATKEVSRVTLRREEVTAVAGTFGDPLRAIENLPSMARAPLIGGQLLVRGTSPRSTGVYIDGVQVPLLYHFGALTSVINPEFLETIDFYPGGFGAKYGRATAGIVDVKTRSLTMKNCRGYAEVDVFDSGFFFGCPITLWGPEVDSDAPNPRRITFAAAGRRSYIDAIIPLFTAFFIPAGAGTLTVAPVYWDYQAKLEYRPLAGHTFQLISFGSDDLLKVLASGGVDGSSFGIQAHTQFHRLLGKWDWRIAPRMTNTVQAFVGIDWTNVGISAGSTGLGLGDTTSVFGLRNELKYSLTDDVILTLGLDYTVSNTRFESQLPVFSFGGDDEGGGLPPITVGFPRVVPRRSAEDDDLGGALLQPVREDRVMLNMAPYVEAELNLFPGFKLVPGFRFDYYKYGQTTRVFSPVPRLAVRWEPVTGTVLKAAYGLYEQPPQSAEVSPNFGQPRLGLERARQFLVGFDQRLTPRLTVAINGFYTWRDNLVTTSNAVLGFENGVAQYERYNNKGGGRVMGVDFLLRHELTKNFYGWIAYTLSRSETRNRPQNPWTLFTYDQTHILTLVGQYKLPWHLPFREWAVNGRLPRGVLWNTGWSILSGDVSVGARWRLVSGNPTTRFVFSSHDLDTDDFIGESGLRNDTRMPTFHQLDVRVDYKMAFNQMLVTLYLDILNVYNQKNVEAIQWDYRYRTSVPLSLLPFLPIFGVSAEF